MNISVSGVVVLLSYLAGYSGDYEGDIATDLKRYFLPGY